MGNVHVKASLKKRPSWATGTYQDTILRTPVTIFHENFGTNIFEEDYENFQTFNDEEFRNKYFHEEFATNKFDENDKMRNKYFDNEKFKIINQERVLHRCEQIASENAIIYNVGAQISITCITDTFV